MRVNSIFTRSIKKVLIISVFVIASIIIFFNGDRSDAKTTNVKNFKCITITDDDTLWTIAKENITEEYDDINEYIDEVLSINNLTSSKIYSGATLVVPYYTDAPQ